jgi:hypothetical protein
MQESQTPQQVEGLIVASKEESGVVDFKTTQSQEWI